MAKSKSICSIEGCSKRIDRKGWCAAHYSRWKRNGDPLGGGTANGAPHAFLERAASASTDECIIWPYSTNGVGYGVIGVNGKPQYCTRLVLEMSGRPKPEGVFVAAHKPLSCHNPTCVNPRHLRWATYSENHLDKRIDGTSSLGKQSNNTKISDDEVRQIRKAPERHRVIAERFGVHPKTVAKIKRRASRSFVTDG